MRRKARYIPLFWRIFVPNVTILGVAGVVLAAEPANGRVALLAGGFAVVLAINLLVLRRSFKPLDRLTAFMRAVDPLQPGQRVPVFGPPSEVTVLAAAFNEMLDRLETERRESARRELATQNRILRSVGREMHDAVGQDLTALALQLDRIASGAVPREQAAEARDLALATVDKVRDLAQQLRPEVLDHLGLKPALAELCRGLSERTGLAIDCALDDPPTPLDPDTALVVYRVVQESLTNVLRHARASRARVVLEGDEHRLVVRVQDDGVGMAVDGTPPIGGLRQMRERALLVGGTVSVDASPGKGTRVVLTVPRDPP